MAFQLFKNQKYLTIDVGFRLVKVIQVRQKENSIEVLNFGIGKTPHDCIKNGKIQNSQKVVSEIKRILSEHEINEREAKILISGTNIITRIMMIDPVPDEEIKNKVMTEIERILPINLNDHRVDFKILGPTGDSGQQKMRVFVTAVRKSIVDSYIEILDSLNLKSISVDTPANSIAKLFEKEINYIDKDMRTGKLAEIKIGSGTVAVIDFGSETTIVNVLKDQRLEFNRVILSGSSNIDQVIFTHLIKDKKGMELGEVYKKKYGIVTKREINNEMEWQCSQYAKSVIDDIIKNINACFEYYMNRCGGERVEKIIMIGGGSQLPGLKDYLQSVFRIPCYPVHKLRIEDVYFMKHLNTDRIDFLVNALGIAF